MLKLSQKGDYMKKIILLMVLALVGSGVYAEVNMPGAPSFGTSEDATTSIPSSAYKKQEIGRAHV